MVKLKYDRIHREEDDSIHFPAVLPNQGTAYVRGAGDLEEGGGF